MSQTDGQSTACLFPSTHWSAVGRAADESGDGGSRQAMTELLTRYLPAMKTFLVLDRRIDPHRSDDLLQGFVAEIVLEKNLFARADRGRGRFRTFLLACLSRYVATQHRRQLAAMRHPGAGRLVPLDDQAVEDLANQCCSDAFDVAWGRQVIAEALDRMREECAASLRPDLWALFEGRVVRPAMDNVPPLDYREIAQRFGFATPAEATNALVTAKRMFMRMLRAVVAGYADGEDVDIEIASLKKVLARAGSAPQPRM